MKIYRIVEDTNDLNNFFFESKDVEECERCLRIAASTGCDGEIVEIEIEDWHNQSKAA